MLAVALLVFIRGVWLGTLSLTRKISKTFSGGLIPNASSLQWRQFFKLFFHWQVIRDHSVGFFHSLIFYGFVILWIATDLLFTIIPLSKYFQVWHISWSPSGNFAGTMILAGIGFASTVVMCKGPLNGYNKPNQERVMYAFWLCWCSWIFYWGIRILGNGLPEGERVWCPSELLWHLFSKFLDQWSLVQTSSRHVVFICPTYDFLAVIPYTKFFLASHSGISHPRRGEFWANELFGLNKFSEMTMKNRFDLISCVECGRCTEIARRLQRVESQSQDNYYQGEIWLSSHTKRDHRSSFGVKNPFMKAWAWCLHLCSCMESAPILSTLILLWAKRYRALDVKRLTSSADATNKSKIHGNPWGIFQEDRFKWADD